MLRKESSELPRHSQIEMTCVDALVPQDHLLRLLEQQIDFSFITKKAHPYYSEKMGRPSIGPVQLFKILLIGYLYGIRSERQLVQEIHLNVAYRWFLGLSFSDPVPDHSTISWNRTKRFQDSNVFQEIFDEVVRLAIHHGMVAGRLLATDSTHIQANANRKQFTNELIPETPVEYLDELNRAVNEERIAHGLDPLPPAESQPQEKNMTISTTDPESGLLLRKGKPNVFAYLDHRTVDVKYNIITDVYVTPGHINDTNVYFKRLQRQLDTFGFSSTIEGVALDAGYMTPNICKKLAGAGIAAYIGQGKSKVESEKELPKSQFKYDSQRDVYVCPQGVVLTYATTNRRGLSEYKADYTKCQQCPLAASCFSKTQSSRKIERHVWEGYKEAVSEWMRSSHATAVYKIRQRTIERSFADAKELHGLRRCRFRGRKKTQEQVLMTAIAQNLKKIVKVLAKRAREGDNPLILLFFKAVFTFARLKCTKWHVSFSTV